MTISTAHHNPAVVIDNGSGFTKIGFAGAAEPQDILQTAVGTRNVPRTLRPGAGGGSMKKTSPLGDLEYIIGTQEYFSSNSNSYEAHNPIKKHGMIDDWDRMEQLWMSCFYDKLRCDPENHYVLLTEQIFNTPENRAETAEVMFETFNVPGLNISVQAVLSLAASWTNEEVSGRSLTGTVVDSGYATTNIIPVVDGHVISNCIEQIAIGGQDVTCYIQQLMKERNELIPYGMRMDVAKKVKETWGYCYMCPKLEREFEKYDSNPDKYIKLYESVHKKTKDPFSVHVKYERFLAPEMVMNPHIYDSTIKETLPEVVDSAILKCPIDSRRALYNNIVLSGGNTGFKDFGRRLKRDISRLVESRLTASRASAGINCHSMISHDIDVNVIENRINPTSSVWLGGSIMASTREFFQTCKTKAQYDEEGPRIMRQNIAFNVEL